MVTRFVAILCFALGGGFVSAAEPPSPSKQPAETAQESKQRLIEMLRTIIANQRRSEDEIRDRGGHYVPMPRSPIPRIGERTCVVLENGGRVRLSHSIVWEAYPEDDLEVTVTASDPSLVVPAKIKLEFEKHQFRFDYEIKAGNKTGDFTVTLKPTVGDALVVKVTVK